MGCVRSETCRGLALTIATVTGSIFFFTNQPTTEIYTLSLHDALPIYPRVPHRHRYRDPVVGRMDWRAIRRSEEHTSELQSHSELVCRLLLEKKNLLAQRGDIAHARLAYSAAELWGDPEAKRLAEDLPS